MLKNILLCALFSDYFSGSYQYYYGPSRVSISSGNSYICDSVFMNFLGSESGSAIYMSQQTFYVVVEKCSFFECSLSNSNSGGAVYLNVKGSVVSNVCSKSCITGSGGQGQFAYLCVSAGEKNFFMQSSITSSISVSPKWALYQIKGAQNIISCNFSKNSLQQGPVALITESSSHNMSFTTMHECVCYNSIGIWIFGCSSVSLYRNNILQCDSPSQGFICNEAVYSKMTECCFVGNKGPIVGVYTGTMEMYYCYTDVFSHAYGAPKTYNLIISSYLHSLVHFNTYFCPAENNEIVMKTKDTKLQTRNILRILTLLLALQD